MKSISKKIYLMIVIIELMLVMGMSPKLVHAGESRDYKIHDLVTSSIVSVRIDNGLLNVRIENATLKEVFEKLKGQVSVEFTIVDPGFGDQAINRNIQKMPLNYVLKTLLDGYSYVLNHKKGLSSVYILSTSSMSYSGIDKNTLKVRNTEKVWTTHNYDDNAFDYAEGANQNNLEQALRSIESGRVEDHGDALEQLVGQDDERATQALIEAALSSDNGRWGNNATDALARHAAEFEYGDQEVISALQTLAHKNQKAIKKIAQHALQEMERFKQLQREAELE